MDKTTFIVVLFILLLTTTATASIQSITATSETSIEIACDSCETCDSCESCTEAASVEGAEILLTSDIEETPFSSVCIDITADDVSLYCKNKQVISTNGKADAIGIRIGEEVSGTEISNCHLTGNHQGLAFDQNSSDNVFKDGILTENRIAVTFSSEGDGNKLINSNLNNNGFYESDTSFGSAIALYSGSQNKIQGNSITGTKGTAFSFRDHFTRSSYTVEDNVFTGNQFQFALPTEVIFPINFKIDLSDNEWDKSDCLDFIDDYRIYNLEVSQAGAAFKKKVA